MGSRIKKLFGELRVPMCGCMGNFHVHVSSKLKSCFSFKKRYSMSNLGLASYNKKFLYCAVGAPGSTHDARMLCNSTIFQKIVTGHAIPDRVTDLGDHGKIPLELLETQLFRSMFG